MKEIYQQTVEEVLERVNGKKSGLTSEQVKRSREKSVGGMNLQKERRKVSCRFSLKELSISRQLPFLVFIRLIQSDKAGTTS